MSSIVGTFGLLLLLYKVVRSRSIEGLALCCGLI